MSFELRYNLLFREKQVIQELQQKHTKMVNKLAHDLQLLGFAQKQREITKIQREINNKSKKLIESI